MTSQAHKAFKVAFKVYKCDPAWIAVAKYLYGARWQEVLEVLDFVKTPTYSIYIPVLGILWDQLRT